MSLSILLSPADGAYRPGSAIRGTVFLTSLTSIAIGSINVTLTGFSRVTLTQNYGDLNVSKSDHHSRAVLFHRDAVLYTGGKWTHQAGQYSWEFEMQVPLTTDRRDGYASQCPFLAGGNALQPHTDLPPSMLYTCRGFGCQVEYVVEATLTSVAGSAVKAKKLAAKTNILLQPDQCSSSSRGCPERQSYARHEQIVRSPKSKSNPLEQTPISRLLKLSKSNQVGGKSIAPSVAPSLNISVHLPTQIEVKEDYSTVDILLSASLGNSSHQERVSDGQSPTRCAAPTLTMKAMKITVNQFTHVRAGHHTSKSTRKTYTRKTTCSLPVRVSPNPDEQSTEGAGSQGAINLGQVTELRIAKEFLVVDFATSNISIEHALDIELGFEYEGKSFEFVRRDVPVKVSAVSAQDARRLLRTVESGGLVTRPSDRGTPYQNAAAQIDRPENSWLVPPPEFEGSSVLERETDAWYSVPPPRYMLRVS
ncbi:hypothetical protein A1O7_02008 [Cladophialophora yegresii CBS 114405]|uniref:Arrestin-like N-terminal domain-containing protein n=1 Tax=Cladophialophora yegresii CBS 114405 TaxID=1182544 RepID=W9W9B2_9EURO|nr:uncharacterized protein A1O7_02008 [Cladophialophora yegresii CBS 114405]EXJ61580.1 hypothetical protein A1O7_02008 [Cladophialophora yegresii CBS 114405]